MLTMVFPLNACGAQEGVQTSAPSSEPSSSQAATVSESKPAESTPQPAETEFSEETENTASENEKQEDTGARVMVAYFSATGTTKALAEYAADAIGADLYEISPAEPYTDADLDYGNPKAAVPWKWMIPVFVQLSQEQ